VNPGKISHYRIITKLGAGGMGEVYLAEDLQLGRRVALKLLPEKFTQDLDRVHRFEREARTVSRLNHPNILTIYEIGEFQGTHFMVTEFVEGQTLRRLLSGRRMPITEALEIAIQIANALKAAHGASITHRDIKPENIMLREDGFVKVLDFGLAKLTEEKSSDSHDPEIAQAETKKEIFADFFRTSPLDVRDETSPGMILGTLSYMSPEQARGVKVDTRTDIFSLGVVVYEMVTGRPPFEAPTPSDVMVALLEHNPPPLARFLPNAPDVLEWIIMKALAKDREERYQRVSAMMSDLKRLQRRIQSETNEEEAYYPDHSDTGSESGGVLTDSGQLRTEVVRYSAAIDSLAVLPFISKSQDPNSEYLREAITESLIVNLSRLSRLRVMAWSTVSRFRDRNEDALIIGRQLGVRAVFTGRMFQFDDSLVIRGELVDVQDGSQIWGGQFHRKLEDLFTIEQQISQEICDHLRVKLNDEEKKRLLKRYTENADAYKSYLRGRYYWNQRTAKGLKKAIECFEEAIRLDERYALAYAGLADCYCLLSIFSAFPSTAALPRAKDAALKALELDDGLAEAHTSLAASLVWYDWNWERSEAEFKRAIELNAAYSVAHHWYGSVLLCAQGRHDEALAEELRALEIEPLSLVINANLGFICYQDHRFEQAYKYLCNALEIDENFTYGRFFLGLTYAQQGKFDDAIAEVKRAIELTGGRGALTLAALGYVSAIAGKRHEAEKVLAQLQTNPPNRDLSPFYLALVHAGLGNINDAIARLGEACDERYPWVVWMKTEPMFDSLRGEEQFGRLVRRIGLS
jgi:eukaryotic-like serine/threonine-protein kinase